jgi:hypothetical protein
VVNTSLERNLLIQYKHGKQMYVIGRFVITVLWKTIISYLLLHAGARLDVGEKRINFRCVTFQNVVQNSCNAGHVTHLQVDLTLKTLVGKID